MSTPEQKIFSAGWWAGYDAGRLDELSGHDRNARIAPAVPAELQHRPGAQLGEIIGRAVVVGAAIIGTLLAAGGILLVIRAIAWLAGGVS